MNRVRDIGMREVCIEKKQKIEVGQMVHGPY